MPLVSTGEMLRKARREGYAVCAFNIENMEMAQAVVEAALEAGSPVILQTTPSTLRYAPPKAFAGIAAALAADADIPVALHLDHSPSVALIAKALAAGYTSAMIDGSHLPLPQNIALTREAVRDARGRIPIEAELGRVGGKEDGLTGPDGAYTDPREAALFVAQTGADALAVGIGTAHGFYSGPPVLDKARLADIRAAADVPLVLHGASGLPDSDVRDCVRGGVCKVNFATELRAAYTQGVREALAADPGLFDPKALGAAGKRQVRALALRKIALCGCGGKG